MDSDGNTAAVQCCLYRVGSCAALSYQTKRVALAAHPGEGVYMIRSELLAALARENPELRIEEIEKIVGTFFDEIAARLANGGRVELRGFGAFSTRERDARIGRNPRTGETVAVPGKSVPYFKPGKEMRARLNSD